MAYQNQFLNSDNESNKFGYNEVNPKFHREADERLLQEQVKTVNQVEDIRQHPINKVNRRSISVSSSSPLNNSHPYIHPIDRKKISHKHHRSRSSSNDLLFVERKHRHGHSARSHKYVPSDFEYKGKLKIKCSKKKLQKVPYHFVSTEIAPNFDCEENITTIPNFMYNQNEHMMPQIDCNHVDAGRYACSGEGWSHGYNNAGGMYDSIQGTQFDQCLYPQTSLGYSHHHHHIHDTHPYSTPLYPPIPPGATLIAQYVKEFDEPCQHSPINSFPTQLPSVQYQEQQQQYKHHQKQYVDHEPYASHRSMSAFPCEHLVEKCVPRSKIIEVWKKQRTSHSHNRQSLDSLKKDIVETLTNEIKKLDLGHKHDIQVMPSEKDVKVVVQPIQPVFYLPKQVSPSGPPPTYPTPQPQAPAPPSVIYVPRNVYVPVIKPVFVPRERVIVRPQIVQVARPVVIDRPIPVTQRPIVIDRERPVPFPAISTTEKEHCFNDQYIYRDNLPLAYGGRTGEFGTGMNYGYVPVNEGCQYIVSGCDDLIREQLVNSQYKYDQHGHFNQQYVNNQHGFNQHDCFDKAMNELNHVGIEQNDGFYCIPRNDWESHQERVISGSEHAHSNVNYVGNDNRAALVETLRRAGTGCLNLEVLDPTIKPVWEPVNAKMLIQRYGQSAVRFIESGSSYGYNPYIPHKDGITPPSVKSVFKADHSSAEYIATPGSGHSYGHSGSSYRYDSGEINNSGLKYDPYNTDNYNYHPAESFEDLNSHKYKSTSSLQMGGIEKWHDSSIFNKDDKMPRHTTVM